MDSKQFALSALKFLNRSMLAPNERAEFTAVENALNAVATGQAVIGKPVEEALAKKKAEGKQ